MLVDKSIDMNTMAYQTAAQIQGKLSSEFRKILEYLSENKLIFSRNP